MTQDMDAPAGEPLRTALAELVALADLKRLLAQTDRFSTDAKNAVLDDLSTDIARRQPLAWAAARAALAAPAGSAPRSET